MGNSECGMWKSEWAEGQVGMGNEESSKETRGGGRLKDERSELKAIEFGGTF